MKSKTVLFSLCLFLITLASCNKGRVQPHVVLISIDGFRHDYAEKYQASNLLKIKAQGTSATSLIPCYPSKTFPNHYSIATGMYPENHGIVDNYFYDSERGDYYMANQGEKVQDGSWYGGTPLWSLTNQNGLKSATFFWIGSEAEINGERPTYYKNYNNNTSSQEITSQVIDWLNMSEKDRPQFISAYFSLVDRAGHDYGIDSPELKAAVQEIDLHIGQLQKEISLLDIPINLIVVSDHGMTNTLYETPIYHEDFIDLKDVNHIYRDSHLMIYSTDSVRLNSMYDTLKSNELGRYTVYRKKDIPSMYHFQNNKRIGDLLLVANPPHIFSLKNETNGKGTHGYDPSYQDMHGIFYAIGSNIKKSLELSSFKNIHIYPMVANLMNLPYDTSLVDGNQKVLKLAVIE